MMVAILDSSGKPLKPTKPLKKINEIVSAEPKPPAAPDLLAAIISAAADPTCQPEKVHVLLDARKRIMMEEAEVGFHRAYRELKAKLPRIDKDGNLDEGTTKSGRAGKKARYATYENLSEKIAPILRDVGLDLTLQSEPAPGGIGINMKATLTYIASTRYGDVVFSKSSDVPMPPDPTGSKNPAQAISSALSYAKRLAVILVCDINTRAPEDRDRDGNAPRARRQAPEPSSPANELEDISDGKINSDQIIKLRETIEACGLTVEKFCATYKLASLADVMAHNFERAIAACQNYRKRAQEGE